MTKQMLSIRASDMTIERLQWLMDTWGTSQTETLTTVITQAYMLARADEIASVKKIHWMGPGWYEAKRQPNGTWYGWRSSERDAQPSNPEENEWVWFENMPTDIEVIR